jgi:hypothetical protein
MRRTAIFGVLVLSSCLAPQPPEGRVRCTAATVDVDCPEGWFCRSDDRCYLSPGDDVDAGRDAGPIVDLDGGEDAGVDAGDGGPEVDSGDAPMCTTTDEADIDAIDANCDGVDGVLGSPAFVYVRPAGMDTGNGASPADAVTLARAIVIANARTATDADVTLLLEEGEYFIDAPLAITPGSGRVVMFGSYAPGFAARSATRSLVGSIVGQALIVNCDDVVIDSVDFATADQTDPGSYTRTITVVGSPSTSLRNLTITAGRGADGAEGSLGATATVRGAMGEQGDNASGAMSEGNGGGSGPGSGGDGGDAESSLADPGLAAAITAVGCGQGGDAGDRRVINCSCDATTSDSRTDGETGVIGCAGARGMHGAGGVTALGTIDLDGSWTAATGAVAGMDGSEGAQGGGGGGGGGIECNNITPPPESSGGGGGEGGLGGAGGGAGGPGASGGASIALVAVGAQVTLASVTLRTVGGGAGGRGGSGGGGSLGGLGGEGGNGFTTNTAVTGCGGAGADRVRGGAGGDGGEGGPGGPGGCGGGGAGGPSIGVFASGSIIHDDETVLFELGAGGDPGVACEAGGGNPGEIGARQELVTL